MMDEFVKEAEYLKSRLAEVGSKTGNLGDIMPYLTDRAEYEDVVLDVKVLIHEFGNQALIDELAKYRNFPNLTDLSYLLGKLIEATKLRNKKT